MATPFRNDADALQTRLASLNEEVNALRSKAHELEGVKERLAELEREQEEARRELDARGSGKVAPLLDSLRIASPCHEKWDDMIGDERTRFCGKCQKDVHNVSALSRAEAEAFLANVGGSVCVRMYKRTDGTVLTADCPVGVRKKRIKRLVLATVGGVAAAAGLLAYWRHEEVEDRRTVTMGAMEGTLDGPVVPPPPQETMGKPTLSPTFATPPGDPPHVKMGAVAPPRPPTSITRPIRDPVRHIP